MLRAAEKGTWGTAGHTAGLSCCSAQHVCVMQGHRERTVIVFVLTAHVPISDP